MCELFFSVYVTRTNHSTSSLPSSFMVEFIDDTAILGLLDTYTDISGFTSGFTLRKEWKWTPGRSLPTVTHLQSYKYQSTYYPL